MLPQTLPFSTWTRLSSLHLVSVLLTLLWTPFSQDNILVARMSHRSLSILLLVLAALYSL